MNIGAAARAISNFGLSELRLVRPYSAAFREARSAVGAGAVMRAASVHASVAEAVRDCTLVVGVTGVSRRQLRHKLYRLEYGARLVRRQSGRVALLFGSEKHGLSNDDLSHCRWLLHIPTRAGHESMNLGQAVAVVLYELIRGPTAARPARARQAEATADAREMLTVALLEALERAGYVNPRAARSTALKLRRMVRRLNLSARDAEVWLGMARQILWKLNSGRNA